MKMPTNCPICQLPLLNEFDKLTASTKYCYKKIDHNITFFSMNHCDDVIGSISLKISIHGKLWKIIWSMPFHNNNCGQIYMSPANSFNYMGVPYFEPNFSNLKALINKLKMYIVFT